MYPKYLDFRNKILGKLQESYGNRYYIYQTTVTLNVLHNQLYL